MYNIKTNGYRKKNENQTEGFFSTFFTWLQSDMTWGHMYKSIHLYGANVRYFPFLSKLKLNFTEIRQIFCDGKTEKTTVFWDCLFY